MSERTIESYLASVQEYERKAKNMPPNVERVKVENLCEYIKDQIIKLEVYFEKNGRIPFALSERIDNGIDLIHDLIIKAGDN